MNTRYIKKDISLTVACVPRNFVQGGFNKFSWWQKAERTGIWGW
jgi:hypothetical protein